MSLFKLFLLASSIYLLIINTFAGSPENYLREQEQAQTGQTSSCNDVENKIEPQILDKLFEDDFQRIKEKPLPLQNDKEKEALSALITYCQSLVQKRDQNDFNDTLADIFYDESLEGSLLSTLYYCLRKDSYQFLSAFTALFLTMKDDKIISPYVKKMAKKNETQLATYKRLKFSAQAEREGFFNLLNALS